MHIQSPIAPSSAQRTPKPSESVSRLLDIVAQETKVSKALLLNGSRCRARTAKARQLAMYLMHVALGQSLTSVGLAFGRDRTTVSYACGLMEDMRDDPVFDRDVERLESLLADLSGDTHA